MTCARDWSACLRPPTTAVTTAAGVGHLMVWVIAVNGPGFAVFVLGCLGHVLAWGTCLLPTAGYGAGMHMILKVGLDKAFNNLIKARTLRA